MEIYNDALVWKKHTKWSQNQTSDSRRPGRLYSQVGSLIDSAASVNIFLFFWPSDFLGGGKGTVAYPTHQQLNIAELIMVATCSY